MQILLADKQGITQAGLMFLCTQAGYPYRCTDNKTQLIEALCADGEAIVILDYTLFDIGDAAELQIISQRFPHTSWILFSEDLSVDFVRMIAAENGQFSILLKESPLEEIKEGLTEVVNHRRYICRRMTEMLLAPISSSKDENKLTPTETEILRDIALGLTTREIAEKRFSSFHTVNTHRKNIFRKIGVNNVHEATRYALRAGLVDSAEYYI